MLYRICKAFFIEILKTISNLSLTFYNRLYSTIIEILGNFFLCKMSLFIVKSSCT